jgi:hypothetical protein
VKEYFLFDPLSEYLKPSLQGFRLSGRSYKAIQPSADGSLLSQELGLKLMREGLMLRLMNATTGEKLLTPDEVYEAYDRIQSKIAKLKRKKA